MRILANSREVLDLLAESGQMTVAEIANVMQVPRATLYRTIDLLAEVNLVSALSDGRCALDLEVFTLDRAARAAYPVAEVARPHLTHLRDATGQSAFLSVPRNDGMLCIDEAPGYEVEVMVLAPGTTLPFNAGAGPRAATPWLARPTATLLLDRFIEFTPRTQMTVEEVLAEAESTRQRGYSVSDGDLTTGVGALGMAIVEPDNQELVATLSVAGLRDRVLSDEKRFVECLREAVGAICKELFSHS